MSQMVDKANGNLQGGGPVLSVRDLTTSFKVGDEWR